MMSSESNFQIQYREDFTMYRKSKTMFNRRTFFTAEHKFDSTNELNRRVAVAYLIFERLHI